MFIHLYINFYQDKNKERQAELDYCVKTNAELKEIDVLHCVVDDMKLYENLKTQYPKIKLHYLAKRPTYHDFFILANQESGTDNCINIISNTDIVFTPTLNLLKPFHWNNYVLCLSRQDYISSGSQDSWIWKGKLKIPPKCNFFLGKMRCDQVIARQFQEAGYCVANPCYSIICHHIHKSNVHNYNEHDGINEAISFVIPCHLKNLETPIGCWAIQITNHIFSYWVIYVLIILLILTILIFLQLLRYLR